MSGHVAAVPSYQTPPRSSSFERHSHGQLVKLISRIANPGGAIEKSMLYVVAAENSGEAIALVRDRLAREGDRVEDVGDVSNGLLQALNLAPGEFTRA
jgi:hypothetical protein